MGPSPSPDPVAEPVTSVDVDLLFALADAAIRAGLEGRMPDQLDESRLPAGLAVPRGAFVTLHVGGHLNGCIGTIDPTEALGVAVPRLAWEAAFADPRLPALTAADYEDLEIDLSLLGPLVPIPAGSESELIANLRPGVDGLVIAAGRRRATFLPAVWRKLGEPTAFVHHLQEKAGLAPGRWAADTRAWRYTVTEHRRRAAEVRRQSPPGPSAAA